jgi:amino-acid N-acetyltransferase
MQTPIERPSTIDLEPIRELLSRHGLPADDIEPHLEHFLVAKDGSEIVGVAGLERYGEAALLRSVCVSKTLQNQGIGARLLGAIEASAYSKGVRALYLLTIDAAPYFERRGFSTIARGAAPAQIRATHEFRTSCPASAACMHKALPPAAYWLPKAVLGLRPDVPGAQMWAVRLEAAMLTYFEVAPGTRFERHSHEGEQITAVIEGTLYFEMDQETVCVGEGDAIAIPARVPHAVYTRDRAARAFDAWSPPFP